MEPVARRTVVAAAGGLAALSTLRVSPGYAAEAPRTSVALTHEGRAMRRFDTDLRRSLPWTAPGVVRVQGSSAEVRGTTLRVEWDGRLADATSSTAIAVVGDRIHEVHGTVRTRGTTTLLLLPLTPLAGFLRSNDVATVALPVHPTDDLEERGFDRVRPTRVALQDENGDRLTSAPRAGRPARTVDGHAWAGSLSVLWAGDSGADSQVGNAAQSFSHPHVVELRSAGPGPVPRGSSLRISADADAVGRLTLADAGADVPTSTRWSRQSGVQTLTVTLGTELPAGRTLHLELSVGAGPTTSTRSARAACSVALVGAGPAELQRITGDESRVLGV